MTPAETLFPEARRAHAEAVTRSVRQRGVHEADQVLVWQTAHRPTRRRWQVRRIAIL